MNAGRARKASGGTTISLSNEANDCVIADAIMLAPPGAAPSSATWTGTDRLLPRSIEHAALQSRDNAARANGVLFGALIMQMTAVLMPAPEGGFTAFNPETGTTSEGESIEEAVANLREATDLYLEEFPLGSVGQPA